jgi:hypothetical protein
MQHLAMVKRSAHDRITPAVANFKLLRPPDNEIQGDDHRAESPHFADLGQVASLEGHHHQDVGVVVMGFIITRLP